jgi:hypothetical protein
VALGANAAPSDAALLVKNWNPPEARTLNPLGPSEPNGVADEPTYFPIRVDIIEAQRRVATDPGVQMIPTAGLPLAADGHLTLAGYEALRDRIRRSLGR